MGAVVTKARAICCFRAVAGQRGLWAGLALAPGPADVWGTRLRSPERGQ